MPSRDLIIPMNALNRAKSRLRRTLPRSAHHLIEELMLTVYMHVVSEAIKVRTAKVHVITPDPLLYQLFMRSELVSSVFLDDGYDLNALHSLISEQLNPRELTIVMADLPLLTSTALVDFFRRIDAIKPDMAIVPSHDDPPGTSILYLRNFREFTLQYGVNSFLKHVTQASQRKYLIYTCNNTQLSFDIDSWKDVITLAQHANASGLHESFHDQQENQADSLKLLARLTSDMQSRMQLFQGKCYPIH